MKIAIGSDHAAFEFKENIKKILDEHELIDVGTNSKESCDFPDFARKVSELLSNGSVERGILICTTGTGMCITANKFPGVRASNFYSNSEASEWIIKHDREHLDSNVLCFSAKFLSIETARKVIDIFLNTNFIEEERFIRRLNKVKSCEI